VQVDLGQRVIEGVAVDIDVSGQLIVTRDDGERETIAVGDVMHLRPA
jgi:biotin-(acetyl-CoA carboxylase) ligase